MTAIFKIAPQSVGVGLKAPHYRLALEGAHNLDFFEVHAENYMGAGGPPLRRLAAVQEQYTISIHGVCLSVGGRDELDADHLDRFATLVERTAPALVSEHLAWSADGGVFLNDLLPPPLTKATLLRTCTHVDQIQSRIGRKILIENPSSYLDWMCNDISEPDFLNELAARTGCGLLLDINNIFVSASNIGFSAEDYVDAVNAGAVCEIHLAGHVIDTYGNVAIRVDNHGGRVCDEVGVLFERFIRRAGPRPALVEWDTDIPCFETLAAEAEMARDRMSGSICKEGLCHASR